MSASEQLVDEPLTAAKEELACQSDFGPGPRGWLRGATSFLAVLTLILVGFQFLFCMKSPDLNDPDIWWHVRNGQFVLQHHQLPREDMYSFTVTGKPWIDSEWLAEIPFYLAYRSFGLVGIKSLSFFAIDAIVLLLLYLCYQDSRNFKASATVCFVGTLLATVSYGPRTVLFGYIDLLILLVVLQRFRKRGEAPLWIIPPLFLIWANTHGSWSLGMILFFLVSVSGLVEGSWGRVDAVHWTPTQLKKLVLTGAASVAAVFVNPYGWRLVYYPFDLAFKQKLNIASIEEWSSVDFHPLRGKLALLLILGLFLAALLRKRRWALADVLMLLFALYSGLSYVRFLILLVIIAGPILSASLEFFPPYYPERETPRLNAFVILLLAGAMIYYWPKESTVQKSVAETYPSSIFSYLDAHPTNGKVLNFYLWGGYLGWKDPNLKVFIDSRVDIFEYAGVLEDYLTLLRSDGFDNRPDAILAKYKIQYVLFPAPNSKNPLHAGGHLVDILESDPHWSTVYKDEICILFERRPLEQKGH